MSLPCLQPKSSDFRGYPFLEYTETKTEQFQRNNCPSGQSGSWVSYSKTYTSYLNEGDLQAQIAADAANFNAAGQANANSQGTCSTSCQAITRVPLYNAVTLGDQAILNAAGVPMGPVSRGLFTTGDLTSTSAITNTATSYDDGWFSAYPHTDAQAGTIYGLTSSGNNLILMSKSTSSGNACSSVTTRTIYTLKSTSWWARSCATEDGLIIVIGYDYGATSPTVRGFDILWCPFAGFQANLIYYKSNPKNNKYSASSCALVYDGTDVYMMLVFKSGGNSNNTIGGIYKASFGSFVIPMVSNVTPDNYSANSLQAIEGCHAGNRVFFIYGEGKGSSSSARVRTIVGSTVASPPASIKTSDRVYRGLKSIRDVSANANVCWVGGTVTPYLIMYSSSSNAWSVVDSG